MTGALVFAVAACPGPPPEDETFLHHTLMEWVRADGDLRDSPAGARFDSVTLYLDASASMRGYADPAGTFEYSRALRAIRNVAEQLNPKSGILLRKADTGGTALPVTEQTFLAASRSPDFYRGGSTNMAAAIRSLSGPDNRGSNRLSRLAVLMSDGIQSLGLSTPDPRCAAGADPHCVNAAIGALIENGWGAHIFGIRSRFSGPVYSEVNGGLLGKYTVTDRSTSRYRPFLIFVLSEDNGRLESVVNRLRDELIRSGVDQGLIRELPLTLPLLKSSQLSLETGVYEVVDVLRPEEPAPNPITYHRDDDSWHKDFNTEPLPEHVQVLEYAWKDINLLRPCAIRVAAKIEFTTAGEIMFGKMGADSALLLKDLTVREIERPKSWYAPPAAKTGAPPQPLRGSGTLPARLAAGGETPQAAEGPALADDGRRSGSDRPSPATWPPAGYVLKRLQFAKTLQGSLPSAIIQRTKGTSSGSLPDGGHLVLTWSDSGDYLPITMLRIDGLLDPNKVRLPSWTEEWSTDDDSQLATANRLLNLSSLVRGLQNNGHIARQGLGPWYLVILPNKH